MNASRSERIEVDGEYWPHLTKGAHAARIEASENGGRMAVEFLDSLTDRPLPGNIYYRQAVRAAEATVVEMAEDLAFERAYAAADR